MANPVFLSGGSTPNRNDSQWFIEQRILGAIKDGGSLSGHGVPAASLGNDGDLYVDLDTSLVYSKAGGVWTNISGSVTTGSGLAGVGNPEGVVNAAAGTTYLNTTDLSLWVKKTGAGGTSTLWVAVIV
jgi:hypothetical protein